MKETRNITLSLPKQLLKQVRLIALERDTSVSGLLSETLEELVRAEGRYEQARRNHLALVEENLDLGTGGAITWDRESLHER